MQRREREARLQADTTSNAVLTQELKVKLLRKELEALKDAGSEATEALQRAEMANAELAHEVVRKEQDLRDLAAVKDARIKDLEGKLHSAQLTRAKEEEALQRKHEALDRLARERDVVLASVKEAHVEQLRTLDARVLELQAHSESLEAQLRRAEWGQADAVRDHSAVVTRLQEEAASLKSSWDAQVSQLSKEVVSRDLQVHALQDQVVQLKAQSARLQQDVDRYKQQLAAAVHRERSLEREKVQLALDWQGRCDAAERDQYRRSEDLIRGLTAAREQATSKLQEVEQRLRDKEGILKALALERDQALQALSTHGLLPEREAQTLLKCPCEETGHSCAPSEIQQLQEQNLSLRTAVAQMRKEMEALNNEVLPSAQLGGRTSGPHLGQADPDAAADTTAPGYVLAFEAEIQNLKHKFKTLEEQLEDALGPPKMSSDADLQPGVCAADWAAGKKPVLWGGPLQAEEAPTVLACRKLVGRIRLLDCLVVALRQKVLQKPPEMDAVRLQLPREVDRVRMEVSELGRQVAELEKHLGTTRKEGNEVVGRTPETTAPRRQGPAGAVAVGTEDQKLQPARHTSEPQLPRKLRAAASSLVRLQREEEPWTKADHHLREELGHLLETAAVPPCPSLLPALEAQSPGEVPGPPLDHSLPLGQLQPGVTAQSQPRIPTATCRSTCQKENKSPKPLQAQELHKEDGPPTQRSASLDSSSLQDTWQLLELGSSPSGPPSQDDPTPAECPAPTETSSPRPPQNYIKTQEVAIEGKKVEVLPKPKPTRPPRSSSAKPRGRGQLPRIRNYNLKE